MGYRYSSNSHKPQVKIYTEKVKVLKAVGETTGQLMVESQFTLDALAILRVDAELREISDHLFRGNIVKQGIVHKQIYYVAPDDTLKCLFEDSPFTLTLDLDGLIPNPMTETQNRILEITPSYTVTHHQENPDILVVQLKIVADVLTDVVEWSTLEVVTHVEVFPRQN